MVFSFVYLVSVFVTGTEAGDCTSAAFSEESGFTAGFEGESIFSVVTVSSLCSSATVSKEGFSWVSFSFSEASSFNATSSTTGAVSFTASLLNSSLNPADLRGIDVGNALEVQVVDGENGLCAVVEGVALIDSVQIDRNQSRLPVVAVNDVRMEADRAHGSEHSL